MSFETLIVNGTVVTATDTYLADVAISGGKVVAVGQGLPRENTTRVIDAKNKYVMPGGIDVHTHLDMPFGGTTSADDFETGTRAAAFGGTTTLIDFAIQYKGQPLRAAFDAWMQKAAPKATTDYAFHCIITDLPNARLEVISGARTFSMVDQPDRLAELIAGFAAGGAGAKLAQPVAVERFE